MNQQQHITHLRRQRDAIAADLSNLQAQSFPPGDSAKDQRWRHEDAVEHTKRDLANQDARIQAAESELHSPTQVAKRAHGRKQASAAREKLAEALAAWSEFADGLRAVTVAAAKVKERQAELQALAVAVHRADGAVAQNAFAAAEEAVGIGHVANGVHPAISSAVASAIRALLEELPGGIQSTREHFEPNAFAPWTRTSIEAAAGQMLDGVNAYLAGMCQEPPKGLQ